MRPQPVDGLLGRGPCAARPSDIVGHLGGGLCLFSQKKIVLNLKFDENKMEELFKTYNFHFR